MPETTPSPLETELADAGSDFRDRHEPAGRQADDAEHVLFPKLPYSWVPRGGEATQDVQLQQFVNDATLKKDAGRKQVMPETFGDRVDEVRKLAGSIKQHTLDHLDHYLQQFVESATAAGAQVHFAKDGPQTNAIITDIAQREGCKVCVKAKSMVTEETHLVPELEKLGIEAIETDLGEFILQIDDDAPSHIVTPMIHKDRAAVGRAFQRELGVDYTTDEVELAMIARDHLRKKFRAADLGISGGNFLVAGTGTVVICTNEGNGRLSTSAPRVHVAVVGIEKLVPDLDGLAVLLKVLARSSTAQPLTCYTHLMTGPRRAEDVDGPERMHIVLVDNGRTEALRPETREMLRCIRCGACLNACPVYRKVGGHSYGSVYSGPIGAILTPTLRELHNYPDLPQASSLCGACFEACPVHIDIPKYLIQLRKELVQSGQTAAWDRAFMRAWAKSLNGNFGYRMGQRAQRSMFRVQAKLNGTLTGDDPYTNRGWLSNAPGPVGGWTEVRDLPTPTKRSFRDWWNKEHAR